MTPAHGGEGLSPPLTAVLRPLTGPSRAFRGYGYPKTCSGSVAPLPQKSIMLSLLPPVACNRAGIGPGRGTQTIVRDRGSGEHAGYVLGSG